MEPNVIILPLSRCALIRAGHDVGQVAPYGYSLLRVVCDTTPASWPGIGCHLFLEVDFQLSPSTECLNSNKRVSGDSLAMSTKYLFRMRLMISINILFARSIPYSKGELLEL